jgi:hypothetical protein
VRPAYISEGKMTSLTRYVSSIKAKIVTCMAAASLGGLTVVQLVNDSLVGYAAALLVLCLVTTNILISIRGEALQTSAIRKLDRVQKSTLHLHDEHRVHERKFAANSSRMKVLESSANQLLVEFGRVEARDEKNTDELHIALDRMREDAICAGLDVFRNSPAWAAHMPVGFDHATARRFVQLLQRRGVSRIVDVGASRSTPWLISAAREFGRTSVKVASVAADNSVGDELSRVLPKDFYEGGHQLTIFPRNIEQSIRGSDIALVNLSAFRDDSDGARNSIQRTFEKIDARHMLIYGSTQEIRRQFARNIISQQPSITVVLTAAADVPFLELTSAEVPR